MTQEKIDNAVIDAKKAWELANSISGKIKRLIDSNYMGEK